MPIFNNLIVILFVIFQKLLKGIVKGIRINHVLDNIEEGVFVLNKNLEIGKSYSRALEDIFNTINIHVNKLDGGESERVSAMRKQSLFAIIDNIKGDDKRDDFLRFCLCRVCGLKNIFELCKEKFTSGNQKKIIREYEKSPHDFYKSFENGEMELATQKKSKGTSFGLKVK